MKRYSIIEKKNKREMVLLKGKPCIYGKCSFCNYILDNSNDIEEINNCNMEILSEINGMYSILEVVNSASVFELPIETLSRIREISDQNGIEIIYFEAYISYMKRLNEIIDFFPNPTNGYIKMRHNYDNKNALVMINVLDIFGKSVYKGALTDGSSFELKSPDGMYILEATGPDGFVKIDKIVKISR